MSGRYRQQSVFLLLVLLVALLACSCFGGGGEEPATTIGGVTATTATGGGGGAPTEEIMGTQLLAPDQEPIVEEVIRTTEDTPAEVVDALTQGKAIVLLFYVPGGADDVSVLKSLKRLETSFRDYKFLQYDYKAPDAYGDLSTILAVGYPPELILIDRTGVIQDVWNGYVDDGTLNQRLVNLGRD
jgi:hypothetical protein